MGLALSPLAARLRFAMRTLATMKVGWSLSSALLTRRLPFAWPKPFLPRRGAYILRARSAPIRQGKPEQTYGESLPQIWNKLAFVPRTRLQWLLSVTKIVVWIQLAIAQVCRGSMMRMMVVIAIRPPASKMAARSSQGIDMFGGRQHGRWCPGRQPWSSVLLLVHRARQSLCWEGNTTGGPT